jgi:hypothetical protein
MAAIAPRAGLVAGVPVTAGIAVSIQIMAPAISVWRRAGSKGRRAWPEPARLPRSNQSAAQPSRATCGHVAAGSDCQVMAIRAAHITPQKQPRPGPLAVLTPPVRAAAAPLPDLRPRRPR